MSTFISYYKVVKDESNKNTLKFIELAGIAQDGIVLNASALNREISDTIQWYIYTSIVNKLVKAEKTLEKLNSKERINASAVADIKSLIEDYNEQLTLLEDYKPDNRSQYAFINRIALAILNSKEYGINYENALYTALKIDGSGDNVKLENLSDTRKIVVDILDKIFEIKECPYLKPVIVKLNLKEISQLVAIASATRTRWTNKGIKTKVSKTIATEVTLQAILFTCKNSFKMVIPVTESKDERAII